MAVNRDDIRFALHNATEPNNACFVKQMARSLIAKHLHHVRALPKKLCASVVPRLHRALNTRRRARLRTFSHKCESLLTSSLLSAPNTLQSRWHVLCDCGGGN